MTMDSSRVSTGTFARNSDCTECNRCSVPAELCNDEGDGPRAKLFMLTRACTRFGEYWEIFNSFGGLNLTCPEALVVVRENSEVLEEVLASRL